MLTTLLILVSFVVVLWLVWIHLTTKSTNTHTFSLLGSIKLLLYRRSAPEFLYNYLNKHHIQDFFCFWAGFKRSFVAIDAEAAQWVLAQKEDVVQKSTFLSASNTKRYFIHNVVFASGETWRRHRLVYNPIFNWTAYQGYYPSFQEVINKFMNVVDKHAVSKTDFDFVPLLSSFTIDLLGKSVLGYNFGRLDGKQNEYYEAYTTLMRFEPMRILTMFFPFLASLPIPYTKKVNHAVKKMDELFAHVVDTHDPAKHDFISMMVETLKADAKAQLSPEEFLSNLFILFVAGHETTSSALSWILYEITNHPEVQQKMYDEIQSTVGDRDPTFDELASLVYIDNVIHETLRFHPPLPSINTRTNTVELRYKDHVIPKGSVLGINVYNIHHGAHWKDSFTFNPDRFLPENSKGRSKFAFLPFSLGPRMCLGNNFSLIEQRLFLVRLLQKFVVCQPQTHPFVAKRGNGLGGAQSLWVSLKPRK